MIKFQIMMMLGLYSLKIISLPRERRFLIKTIILTKEIPLMMTSIAKEELHFLMKLKQRWKKVSKNKY